MWEDVRPTSAENVLRKTRRTLSGPNERAGRRQSETNTMAILLDNNAQKLLNTVSAQAAIAANVNQAIEAKVAQVGNVALTAQQLQEVLLAAMPAQKPIIDDAAKACHQCDNTNGKFVSTIATLMIEKEKNAVYNPPPAAVPPQPRRDPLTAEIIMGKDTDFLVVANAGVFDGSKKPLALKVLAREKADMSKLPDVLKQFHTTWGDSPDIVKVPNDAAYVKLSDEQENEFQFGHGVAVVSFDSKAGEQGRNGKINPLNKLTTHLFQGKAENGKIVPDLTKPVGAPQVTQGANLDTTAVLTYSNELSLGLAAKATYPKGAWTEVQLAHLDTQLNVGAGYILEPGTQANVALWGMNAAVAVPGDDFSFVGSKPAAANLPANYGTQTLATLLAQSVVETSRSSATATDQTSKQTKVSDLLYREKDAITLGGQKFEPLMQPVLTGEQAEGAGINASIKPLAGDAQSDGFCVNVKLSAGFAKAEKPADLAGWTVEIGYMSPTGWQEAGSAKIDSSTSSKSGLFTLQVDNPTEAIAANRNLEVRLRNDKGIPAGRMLVPFKTLKWAA